MSMFTVRAGFIQRCVVVRVISPRCQHLCTMPTPVASAQQVVGTKDITSTSQRALKISRQMKIYLEKKQKYEDFIQEQEAEFEIGKRHLANIMGRDPDNFTQEDIDRAIKYLLPSGLFEPKARPMMVHPSKLFPPQRGAQFDMNARPFHFLFYTGRPNFYQIMHDIESHLFALYKLEDEKMRQGITEPDPDDILSLAGYDWISKEQLEAMILERITEEMFDNFVSCMSRLMEHPYSYKMKDFVMTYFNKLPEPGGMFTVPEIQYDADGRAYTTARGRRKEARAEVTCHAGGTGCYYVNNVSLYQRQMAIQIREMLLFPLAFTRMLGLVDVNASVVAGGRNGQAGAVRHALSQCLTAFVSDDLRERMRQAGLLQHDFRRLERQKPGLRGARKRPTWRKR